MTGRQGRKRKQLMDVRKKKARQCWKFKDEALARTVWRTHFGRGCGPVVRHTMEWINSFPCFSIRIARKCIT